MVLSVVCSGPVAVWLTFADRSSVAKDGAVVPGLVRSGTFQELQPSAPSSATDARRLSLPFVRVVAPFSAAMFALLNWAVLPPLLSRYWVWTLSLWSWSTTKKSRTVGHALPSLAVPSGGTTRVPAAIAASAAL